MPRECTCSESPRFARRGDNAPAFGQTSEGGRYGLWSARGEYGAEFTCSLDNFAVNAAANEIPTTDRLTLYFVWSASRGLDLNVWGRPLGKVRMHVEAVGNGDTWDVGFAACVAAAAAGVAPVQTGDGNLIFQMVDDERCGFRQWFSFDDFPVGLSLCTFARQTNSGTAHGRSAKRRQQPDQVDAVSLFGGTWSRTCAGVWWRTRQALGGDDGGLPGGSFQSGRYG